jgi:Leucine-rich repeat (LRR) protein
MDLSDNPISDIEPLTKQTDLTLCMIRNAKVENLQPLLAWARADSESQKRFAPFLRLYLEGNPLSDAAKDEQIKALKDLGMRIHF